jgi:hypothetical protein
MGFPILYGLKSYKDAKPSASATPQSFEIFVIP